MKTIRELSIPSQKGKGWENNRYFDPWFSAIEYVDYENTQPVDIVGDYQHFIAETGDHVYRQGSKMYIATEELTEENISKKDVPMFQLTPRQKDSTDPFEPEVEIDFLVPDINSQEPHAIKIYGVGLNDLGQHIPFPGGFCGDYPYIDKVIDKLPCDAGNKAFAKLVYSMASGRVPREEITPTVLRKYELEEAVGSLGEDKEYLEAKLENAEARIDYIDLKNGKVYTVDEKVARLEAELSATQEALAKEQASHRHTLQLLDIAMGFVGKVKESFLGKLGFKKALDEYQRQVKSLPESGQQQQEQESI